MATVYPGAIDGYSQLRVVRDGIEEILARDHNDLRSAVVAVERTLGTDPQGSFGTVVARLDDAYSNLANHVLGGLPRHTDDVIVAEAKSSGSFNLSLGTVQSQLTSLLGFVNSISTFTGLSDTPGSLSADKTVRVDATGSALEFSDDTFLRLTDTPGSFTADKTVRVDPTGSALEFSDDTFLRLTDAPSSFSGQGGNNVRVNAGETGLEFVAPSSGAFTDLTDTPGAYSGFGGYFIKVNAGGTALEFGTSGAVSVNFTDLLDTPSSYSGQGGKIVSIKEAEDGVETRVELPTEFLRKAFDSFVIEGLEVTQDGVGINAILGTGRLASNGRIVEISSTVPLTTNIVSGDYYVAIKFDPDTEAYEVVGPTSTVLDAVGDSLETAVLLKKFTHNGSTWTDSVDLRRYGMLTNNKSCFTVGNNANVPDGYGADFTSLKTAVEYVKALNASGSTKMSPQKILLVDDVLITSADELSVLLDIEGLVIDGGGRTITSQAEGFLFDIEADYVRIENIILDFDLSSSSSTSGFAAVGSTTNVSGLYVSNNVQNYSNTVAPTHFIVCSDGSGTYTVSGCVFSSNIATSSDFGIAASDVVTLADSKVIEDCVIEGNTFLQATTATETNSSGFYVSHNCLIDGNTISGGFTNGVYVVGENVTVSDNFVNGGTGTADSVGSPVMENGINIIANAVGDSLNCVVSGNTVKGITTYGIYSNAAHTIVSNNYVTNLRDAGGTSMIGIREIGTSSSITGNYVYAAGQSGIRVDMGTLCSGNFIIDSLSSLSYGIQLITGGAPTVEGAAITNNFLFNYYGIGIHGGFHDRCVISGNFMHAVSGSTSTGITNVGSESVISDNVITNHNGGINLNVSGNNNHILIANNSISGMPSPSSPGISLDSFGTYYVVHGNKIGGESDGIDAIGIDGNSCKYSIISDNHIFGALSVPATDPGIDSVGQAATDSFNVISGNHLYNINGVGIYNYGGKTSIIGNSIYNTSGSDGINTNEDFNIISDNKIHDAGRYGILDNGSRSFISGNTIISSLDDGILLNSSADDTIVINNQIFDPTGNGITISEAERPMICGNLIWSASSVGISATSSINFPMISNNYIYASTSSGIQFTSGGTYIRCLISNNFFYLCNNSIKLESGSEDAVVTGNYIYDDDAIGVDVDADYAMVSNNYVYQAGSHGIVYRGESSLISNNYVANGAGIGIYGTAGYSAIIGNSIRENTGFAAIQVDASDMLITSNQLLNNGGHGIYVPDQDRIIVVGNWMNGLGGTTPVRTGIDLDNVGTCNLVVGNFIIQFYEGITAQKEYSVVSNNSLWDVTNAINVQNSNHCSFMGNVGYICWSRGIDIDFGDRNIAMGNFFQANDVSAVPFDNDDSVTNTIVLGNGVVGGSMSGQGFAVYSGNDRNHNYY